jgi:hypothetical protein
VGRAKTAFIVAKMAKNVNRIFMQELEGEPQGLNGDERYNERVNRDVKSGGNERKMWGK